MSGPHDSAVGETVVAHGHSYKITAIENGHVWLRTSAGPAWVPLDSLTVDYDVSSTSVARRWRTDAPPSTVVPGQIGSFG